ncbi:MAG: M24 family metallopeptidase [Anaerolineae bacterium]|jgi:Xaa-Pro aminopeptidase|nr:M24 family metallopeptidase [Anaerolineae bacterium]
MRRLTEIQAALREERLDGWLLYDFKGINPLARSVTGLPADRFLSRRWACYIPATGEPRWLVHAIEAGGMKDVAPDAAAYVSWPAWTEALRELTRGAQRVAMEVSPGCAIPYVSRVDAGTVELIRSLGLEVVTSADLVQVAEAVWSPAQLASHRWACGQLLELKEATFAHARARLAAGETVTECGLQDFMMRQIDERGLVVDHAPIVGVNAHGADPHFAPRRDADTELRAGDFLLIDLWGKRAGPEDIVGDITWVAYAGQNVPVLAHQVFDVVKAARDRAVAYANERLAAGGPVYGYEVDDACRKVIADAGYGDYFIHRTGHSLGTVGHANGVNIDNLETQDRRRLIPGVGFSIEPGIYLPHEGFGVRLEINCYVAGNSVEVTTLPLQDEWVLLA